MISAPGSRAEALDAELESHRYEWFGDGRSLLDAQLRAMNSACRSIRLEMYIFTDSEVGARYRDALIEAARRGVRVRLLIDAIGSFELSRDYFRELDSLPEAEFRWFNPPRLESLSFRDHRKVVVIDDDEIAFTGGANIASEYTGDGVGFGWRDGGISVQGPVVEVLAQEFDAQFARASKLRWRSRARERLRIPCGADVDALFVVPGLGRNALRDAMRRDFLRCRDITITCAYFLPSRSLRRQLAAAVRRGGRVRLILAGRSDVGLMLLASRSLYRGLLRAGVEIFEYQPQILHAKTFRLDDIVYVGSANLDPRSLRINFELMLRIRDDGVAEAAREQFERDLAHSLPVTLADLRRTVTWWMRLRQKLAFWMLARVDPLLAESALKRWHIRRDQRMERRIARRGGAPSAMTRRS